MTDNMKQFCEKVSKDELLGAELKAAFKGAQEAEQTSTIIEFAKQKGFTLTREDFADMDADLDLDELENVTGAGVCVCYESGLGSDRHMFCSCKHLGTGYHDRYREIKYCSCAQSGFGSNND